MSSPTPNVRRIVAARDCWTCARCGTYVDWAEAA